MPLAVTTLKKRADFLRLNRGRKWTTPYFILRFAQGEGEGCRVGYTVTTKCGNAVVRNRIKRRLRALVRELVPEAGMPGMDYVLIARAEVATRLCTDTIDSLRAAMREALGRARKP